jgi:hypothetical protein
LKTFALDLDPALRGTALVKEGAYRSFREVNGLRLVEVALEITLDGSMQVLYL